jgi:hypothetical protein
MPLLSQVLLDVDNFLQLSNVIITDPDPHPRFYARIRIWQKDAAPDHQY